MRHRVRRVVPALALATLAACGGEAPRAGRVNGGGASVGIGPTADTPTGQRAAPSDGCPGRDFAAFLRTFSELPALQRRFTRDPLPYRTIEDAGSGPEPVERTVPADSIRNTLHLSAAQRARDSLQVRIDSARTGRRIVTLFKPDTDYQVEYTFERRPDGCWELARYDDQSL